MRYCVSCGLSVEGKWSFCPNCGTSKVPEKESNPVSKNVIESNGPNNQNQDETIYVLIAIIGIAFILFAIDKGLDWRDLADAADDCFQEQEELEDLELDGYSYLCTAAEREASELFLETVISLIIGLLLVFSSSGKMGEEDRPRRTKATSTKPRHKLNNSDRELKNRLQRNTRSNPIRCRTNIVRCSNFHLNKMYCDEHIAVIESRMESESE